MMPSDLVFRIEGAIVANNCGSITWTAVFFVMEGIRNLRYAIWNMTFIERLN
jgi:hypothetical protein